MLKDVFDMFIKHISLIDKETTASTYYSLGLNHILYKFGSLDMSTINSDELINHIILEKKNNLSEKDGNLSDKTLYDLTTLINSFWSFAYKKRYVKDIIHIPVPKLKKKKISVFHEIERNKIEEYLLKHMSPCELAVFLCLYTGLRIGEICALKWGDINLDTKEISVNKTVIRIKNLDEDGKTKTKVIISSPKSETSIRLVPIPDFMISFLKRKKGNNDCYIATNFDYFMEPRLLQKRYKTILKRADVTYKNFHVLRHTFATNAYNNGMGITTLSEILGHSDIQTTLRLYVHTSIEQKQKEMNLIYSNQSALI